MRQLLFDEINSTDIKKIKDYLTIHTEAFPLSGIYWMKLLDFADKLLDILKVRT